MKKSLKAALVLLLGLFLAVTTLAPTVKAEENAAAPKEGYTAWESDSSLPKTGTVGKYYLTKDITMTAQTNFGCGTDLTIDLMGHNIRQATDGKRLIRLSNGANLTIEDSTASGAGASYKAGALIAAANAAEQGTIIGIYNYSDQEGAGLTSHFVMKSGIMDGSANTSTKPNWGGAIALGSKSAQVDLLGGQYKNFTAARGAIIGGTGASCFDYINIQGGEFFNNYASGDSGGGVIGVNGLTNNARIMIGGRASFYNNTAVTGAVMTINNSAVSLHISGGTFYNNEATTGHGAVLRNYVKDNEAAITISGGYFHDNKATGGMGGFGHINSPVNITGGQFYNNYSLKRGLIYTTKNISLADCTIINNKNDATDANAGTICPKDSACVVSLSGVVTISGNTNGNGLCNLLLPGAANVTGLAEGSCIMYTPYNNTMAAMNATEDMIPYMVPDDASKKTVFNSGVLEIADKDAQDVTYTFSEGAGSIFTQNTEGTLTFKCDAAAADLTAVKVDGNVVDEKFYTVEAGSTIVTLSNEYLAGQSKGQHTIALVYGDNETAPVAFYVNGYGADTGDMSNIALWLIVMAAAAVLTGAAYTVKRRSFNH